MSMLKKKSQSGVKGILAVVLALALVLPLVLVPAPAGAEVPDGVYSFGGNSDGQLGLGDRYGTYNSPVRIEGLENVKSVVVGDSHSLALLHNGDVYSFGSNMGPANVYGMLGHGDQEDRYAPTKIEGIGKVKDIGAGRANSFLVMENGDLYSFGKNDRGQLGHGDTENRLVPTRVQGISDVVAVDGGQTHTLVLLANGDVYSIGYSGNGQLGEGDGGGLNHPTPMHVASLSDAKAIAAGTLHSLVLLENGDVYSFGRNRSGELGYETSGTYSNTPAKIEGLGPAKAIAAGSGFSLVLLENGDLYTFGYNRYSQLGQGDTEDRGHPTKVEALSGVSLINSGYRHSLAILENGDVYSFGQGSGGKLGHGDTSDKPIPTRIEGLSGNNGLSIAAGYSHSLVLVGTPPITIEIDGQRLQTEVPPLILEGRTMVPLRAIFEALDTDVDYDPDTRLITGTRGATRIELTVDSTAATVNGEAVNLDAPATVMDGRTLVPVRFIAESTGQDVDWEPLSRTVLITTIEPKDVF